MDAQLPELTTWNERAQSLISSKNATFDELIKSHVISIMRDVSILHPALICSISQRSINDLCPVFGKHNAHRVTEHKGFVHNNDNKQKKRGFLLVLPDPDCPTEKPVCKA
jgi:hypothetical protein